jgi:hypothetical protein
MLMGDNPLLAPEGFGVGPDPVGARCSGRDGLHSAGRRGILMAAS